MNTSSFDQTVSSGKFACIVNSGTEHKIGFTNASRATEQNHYISWGSSSDGLLVVTLWATNVDANKCVSVLVSIKVIANYTTDLVNYFGSFGDSDDFTAVAILGMIFILQYSAETSRTGV